MRAQKHSTEEKGPLAPAYIVTFSALVVLLLMFFVLLLTFAPKQEGLRFDLGQASFRWSLVHFGLSNLSYGKRTWPDFGNIKVKYIIEENEDQQQFPGRIINAREEQIRRIFKDLSRSMKTSRSQIVGQRPKFTIADIHFRRDKAVLDEKARRFLAAFSSGLQHKSGSRVVVLYVVGLAGPGSATGAQKQQWILSAQRAQVVAEFLRQTLPAELDCRIYSWGAGPGGDWAVATLAVRQQSHILIGILERGAIFAE